METGEYHDEFRERLHKVIEKRMKSKGLVTPPADEHEEEEETTNVVDFMELLKKSIASNKRTPATAKRTRSTAKSTAAKTPRAKAAAKSPRKRRRKSA